MNHQIKSKERVAAHGEVFTSEREVNAMLNLVKQETERIDSSFLEPACGDILRQLLFYFVFSPPVSFQEAYNPKICFGNIMFTKHNNIENFQHNIGIMLQKHYVCRA